MVVLLEGAAECRDTVLPIEAFLLSGANAGAMCACVCFLFWGVALQAQMPRVTDLGDWTVSGISSGLKPDFHHYL